MKAEGQKLQSILRRQVDTVRLVDDDGRERCGISARYAADFILEKEYIGFGKNGAIEFLKPAGMDGKQPFATTWDVRQLMADYPSQPPVQRNYRARGSKTWVQQPVNAKTGRAGSITTIFVEK
jgi:hypothetical protein